MSDSNAYRVFQRFSGNIQQVGGQKQDSKLSERLGQVGCLYHTCEGPVVSINDHFSVLTG